MSHTKYCDIELNKAKYETFVYAVKNHYWYQMYMDDLPIWGEFAQMKRFVDIKLILMLESDNGRLVKTLMSFLNMQELSEKLVKGMIMNISCGLTRSWK